MNSIILGKENSNRVNIDLDNIKVELEHDIVLNKDSHQMFEKDSETSNESKIRFNQEREVLRKVGN